MTCMRDMTHLDKCEPPNKEEIDDILGLTPVQEGLLFHYLEDPAGGYYSGQLILDLSGEIEKRCFEQAWEQVILQNEMLRAVFRWEKVKQPVQLILKNPPVSIRHYELSGENDDENKRLLEEIQSRDRQEGFDLHDVPFRVTLCKTGRDHYRMMVSSHHILYDGWSSGLILEEFFTAYGSISHGHPLERPIKVRLKDYIKWFRERKTAEGSEADYWKDYLEGLDTRAGLAIKSDIPGEAGTYPIKFPQDEVDAIAFFLQNHKVSLAVLFYTVWGILLQAYTGSNDVLMGTTVSGRSVPLKGIEHTVGMLINTLPLRIRTASNDNCDGSCESRLDLLLGTAEALQNRRPYENTTLSMIKEYAGWRERNAGGALFDTIVVVENYPLLLDPFLVQESSGLSITSFSVYERTHYDLAVTVKTFEDIEVDFVYSECFAEKDIVRLAGHFRKVVREIITAPSAPLETIDMLSEEEKRQIIYEFNNTAAVYPNDKTIHELFAGHVEKTPDRIAIIGHGRTQTDADNNLNVGAGSQTCPITLSYYELNEQSNRLAGLLINKGVLVDSIVGIMMERSLEMIIGIFGILKAGAAYLPIDPSYPEDRIDYMLKDSGAKIVVNEKFFRGSRGAILQKSPHCDVNLAYIIYTSGSTGRPKGVMVEHCSLVNRIIWMQKNYPLGSDDVVLQKTPITFDVSVWELFWWGIAGASLCLLGAGGEKDPAVIATAVERHAVSVMHFVPSMLHLMLEYIESERIAGRLKTLRQVFSSGEVLSPARAAWFTRLLYDSNKTQLTNLYGPTEATVDVSWYNCFGPDHMYRNTIPIGRPIDNIKLVILDRYCRLVPVGAPGELCIAGVGVARGYLNNPELTAERFNRSYRTYKTYINYKTGDLARWLSDGNIEYLGRIDRQVKIRGFRIELGEIENRLLQYESLKEAIVSVNEDADGDKYLCAYIVSDKRSPVDAVQLKEYLFQSLPGYMIPARFVYLEKIPVTPAGKVDRRALPGPGTVRPASDIIYTAPESDIEKKVVGLWKEVLNLGRVGVNDNFFDLGGHSLHIVRLTGRLKELFEKEIPVTTMFRYPTIRSLVRHLNGEIKEAPTSILRERKQDGNEIAVIGMAVRFPGAVSIEEFWNNLIKGVESITFFTDEQLREAGIPGHLIVNPHYVKAKGVLENSFNFDAQFFEYSSREARLMDPQLRVLHECAWEALENAGYDSTTYTGNIGVYIGALPNASWLEQVSGQIRDYSDWLAIGSLTDRDFFSTRLAYKFNLRGPAVSVQTACSSSLVAIANACRDLESGDCDIALAGGVSISHEDENGYLYQEGMVRSADGRCRAFDARADGTVGGNGAGIVVLKPLAAALVDGDFIHAVVKGAAVNNDGSRKVGYTAPSIEGQAAVVRAALRKAGVEPETITFVEAHGTGTRLGDPVEIEALKLAFNTHKKQFCAVGSVKTNIGHLDAAAGVAGFIKTVLALERRLLPPSLHFQQPNPAIDFDNTPFYVNTRLSTWQRNDFPLRAGVSSFGIGGTNVHVVLEEFTREDASSGDLPGREVVAKQLLVLSARTAAALDGATRNLAEYLRENNHANIRDVAYTLQVGRRAFEHRRTAVVSGIDDAVEILPTSGINDVLRLQTFFTAENDRPVVFMFPGQGSQYVNMGLGIYQREPLFRQEMDRCFEILKPLMGNDVKEVLYPFLDGNRSNRSYRTNIIDQTEITQPVIFITEYALAKLLMSWGIKPNVMIGHSIGEYTAACLAGVFSLEDALQLVVTRGKLMQQTPSGAMLAVSLPEERVNPFLDECISMAAVNGLYACVVAGPVEHIERLAVNLGEAGIETRMLQTTHAYHSAMMDPILEKFQSVLRSVKLNPPRIPYIANVSGAWITPQQAVDIAYWANHLRKTVRFADGLTEILKEERALLMEVGPGRTLSAFVARHPHKKKSQEVINLLRHPKENVSDHEFLLERIGRMWGSGLEIDWMRFNSLKGGRRIPLPTYPFNSLPYRPTKDKSPSEEKKKDMADWFYVPVWRQALHKHLYQLETGVKNRFTWLVFMDDTGFGSRLADRLEKEEQRVIRVEKGKGFRCKSNGVYTIDPLVGADYEKVLEILAGIEKESIIRILHLWGITQAQCDIKEIFRSVEADLDYGFYSLIYLAQAIGTIGLSHPLHINIITNDMQPVVGDEILCPGKAAVLGPVKIIPLEYPNIRCSSIDIRLPASHSIEEDRLIENIVEEIFSEGGPPVVAAFRGGKLWEQAMEPLLFEKSEGTHPRLREKGVYLITGGLGGIGYTLAEHLAANVKARLILVGRSELTPGGPGQEKIKHLETLGAEILAFSCDVSDVEGMKRVINDAVRRFGPIDGILHAAGVADYAGVIQRRTRAMSESILNSKIKGALVLDILLEGASSCFMVFFSSIGSVAWGQKFGQVAYAAANEFLDVYAFHRAARTGWFSVSVNWSDWQEVGMAVTAASHWARTLHLEGDPRSLLKDALLPAEGVEAFRRILEHRFTRVVVSPGDLTEKIENSAAAFQEVLEQKVKSHTQPPMGDVQQVINTVWQEFLGRESVGCDDNFFDLGASSLDIIQVNNRLKAALHREIPLVALYTYPTIRLLSNHLGYFSPDSSTSQYEGEISREEKRKEQAQGIEHSRRKLNQTIKKLRGGDHG
ncbi:MAG: Amino acid adenylation protein [Acidobacteriota bacterium]|nr:Amino acid adenylation protein [Acidobacteriota bacterium]